MALQFFCGFDGFKAGTGHMTTRIPSASASYCNVVTTGGRNGKGVLYILTWGTNNSATFQLPNGPHTNGIVLGIAFKRYDIGVARALGIFTLKNSGGTAILTLMKNTSGYLEVRRGGSTGTLLGTGTTYLDTAATWFFVELKVTIHASTGTVEVHIDGVNEASLTLTGQNTEGAAGGATQCMLNGVHGAFEVVGWYFDDLYFADATPGVVTDFVGDCQSDVYMVDADTAQKDFSRSAGGDNYALVDEAIPNDDTDYVHSTTSGHKDRYTVTNPSLTGVNVLGVNVTTIAKEPTAGATQIKHHVKHGTTELAGSALSLGTAYQSHATLFEKNPDTAAQWTPSELDSIEIGHELV